MLWMVMEGILEKEGHEPGHKGRSIWMLGKKALQAVKPQSKGGAWSVTIARMGKCQQEDLLPGLQTVGWTGKRGPPSGSSWHCLLSGCLTCSAWGSPFLPWGCGEHMCWSAVFIHHPPAQHPRRRVSLGEALE